MQLWPVCGGAGRSRLELAVSGVGQPLSSPHRSLTGGGLQHPIRPKPVPQTQYRLPHRSQTSRMFLMVSAPASWTLAEGVRG